MSSATAVAPVTNLQRLREMHRYIAEGRVIDAMNEFYAPDAVMQENSNAPTKGLQANIEREIQFLETVAQWKGFEVTASAADGDTTFYESTMAFTTKTGVEVNSTQVAVARWRDGRIIHERFHYDSATH